MREIRPRPPAQPDSERVNASPGSVELGYAVAEDHLDPIKNVPLPSLTRRASHSKTGQGHVR